MSWVPGLEKSRQANPRRKETGSARAARREATGGQRSRSFRAKQITMSLKGFSQGTSRRGRVKNRFRNAPLILDGQTNVVGLRDGSRSGLLRGRDHQIADRAALNFGGAADDGQGGGSDASLDAGGMVLFLWHGKSPLFLLTIVRVSALHGKQLLL